MLRNSDNKSRRQNSVDDCSAVFLPLPFQRSLLSPFLQAAFLGPSSSRKPSQTSTALAASLPCLSTLPLYSTGAVLGDSECWSVSLPLSLSGGPTGSSGQGMEAEGAEARGWGGAMLAQQAPPPKPPEISAQEVYPGSCGDSTQNLQTSRLTEGGGWTPAMCPGQQRKEDTCFGAFLSVFYFKGKNNNKKKTVQKPIFQCQPCLSPTPGHPLAQA